MTSERRTLPRRSLLALSLVVVVAAASTGCAFFGEGINIELTQDQLQNIVGGMFPLDNSDADARVDVTLANPVVTIADGTDRVRMAIDVTAAVELIDTEERPAAARAGNAIRNAVSDRERTPLTGTVAVSTGIRYDNDHGQIFLESVNIEQLDIDRLPDNNRGVVRRLISASISRALQDTPIYTLEEAGTIGNIADTLLRDLTIADGVLRITIGVG